MSAGAFEDHKYQERKDSTKIHPIRVQPETLNLTIDGVKNTDPSEDKNQSGMMKITKHARAYGKRPMRVRFRWTEDPPTGYKKSALLILPLLNKQIQDKVDLTPKGLTGVYFEKGIVTVGKSDEQIT